MARRPVSQTPEAQLAGYGPENAERRPTKRLVVVYYKGAWRPGILTAWIYVGGWNKARRWACDIEYEGARGELSYREIFWFDSAFIQPITMDLLQPPNRQNRS